MLICPHPLLLYLIIKEPLYSQIPSGTEVLWAGKQGWGALDSSPPEPLGAPSHRHHPSGRGFAAVWLAQGHRENLYWSKTKDVRLQWAVPHSKGRLSHSDKALQLAIEPSDYVIHTKNTRHFHQLLTSLLSFFPAGQSNYLMCMQRHNKISTTRMVTLHSWSTSSLLFSPKIEIRREKKAHKLWNLAGTAGNHTLSHRALSASVPTASFSRSHIQHSYLPVLFLSPKLALEILFFLCSLKYPTYPVSKMLCS